LSPTLIALSIISAIVGVGSLAGFSARFYHKMDLEQWTVGGRGFGLILVWLLMAGEIYTTFTFLGASGWAYSRGGPVLYILGYGPLMYLVAFYILPLVWEEGRKHNSQTIGDFFQARYGKTYLSPFVALVGMIFLLPYVQLQLTGLGIIVEVASYGAIHRTPSMLIGFALVAGFVFVSGIRGIAWASTIKDVLLLFTALFIGISIPYIYFGGIGHMFAALIRANPGHLVMPGATKNLTHSWYLSSVLMTACGFFMWPHNFAAAFTARSGKILRRNAILMPLYGVTMPLMMFVGLTAVLVVPNLSNGDLALLTIVRKTFPAWFLGIIGGAGALTAMVPAAIQILASATLFSKNICRPVLAPNMTDRHVAAVAKSMVLILTSGALYLALKSSVSLVSLLLMGYAGVAQFFPGIVLGLYSKTVSGMGIFVGIVSGVAVVALLMLTGRDPWIGMNPGFVALCVNFAVVIAFTVVRPNPALTHESAFASKASVP
jgi:solute:Na+ symporter, SSS family